MFLFVGSLYLFVTRDHQHGHVRPDYIAPTPTPAVATKRTEFDLPFFSEFSVKLDAAGRQRASNRNRKAGASLRAIVSNAKRADLVVAAFRHSYKNYETFAFGFDELAPVSRKAAPDWLRLGITVVDSLDTMMLMINSSKDSALELPLERATKWLSDGSFDALLDDEGAPAVSTFETTIRVLGGLLSAHHLSGEEDSLFLAKAHALGERLVRSFDQQSGLPRPLVHLASARGSHPTWMQDMSSLAEIGSLSLEFTYLSHASGDMQFARAAHRIMSHLAALRDLPIDGLWPLYYDTSTGEPRGARVSIGSMGDSFYETVLKMHLMTGSPCYADMYYRRALPAILEHMVQRSSPNNMLYLADIDTVKREPIHQFSHLACFAGGLLALSETADALAAGVALTETCASMAVDMSQLGVAPELVQFLPDNERIDAVIVDGRNLLRPEIVESLYVLHRRTGNERYRELGWLMFVSFQVFSKTPTGFSGLRAVDGSRRRRAQFDDAMPSWWLAETLKYFYALFVDDDVLGLDGRNVLTTEAHPLPRFTPSAELASIVNQWDTRAVYN